MRVCILASAVLFGALGPVPARADSPPAEDWFASVWTPGGLEVRADARLFTLFALLNRAGHDAGPVRREHPVPAFRYGPARTRVREALLLAPGNVLKEAQAFFDAHPRPLEAYVARVLEGPSTPGARELDGLEPLLARVETDWPVSALRAETADDYRAAQRAWLPVVEGPLKDAARFLNLPDGGPSVQVVVNLLDAEGTLRVAESGRGWVLVVGSEERPQMEPVVRGWAAYVLARRVGGQVGARWAGGEALLREARALGAREETVEAYGVALLSRALALRATGAPEAAYVAAGREGYFGLKALARSFEDARPVDAWALERLARVVSERPLRK